MEVATRQDFGCVSYHQRVIGDGIRLNLKRACGKPQNVNRGARHLGLTADAIGVLHANVTVTVTLSDRTSVKKFGHGCCDFNLALMTAQAMDCGM